MPAGKKRFRDANDTKIDWSARYIELWNLRRQPPRHDVDMLSLFAPDVLRSGYSTQGDMSSLAQTHKAAADNTTYWSGPVAVRAKDWIDNSHLPNGATELKIDLDEVKVPRKQEIIQQMFRVRVGTWRNFVEIMENIRNNTDPMSVKDEQERVASEYIRRERRMQPEWKRVTIAGCTGLGPAELQAVLDGSPALSSLKLTDWDVYVGASTVNLPSTLKELCLINCTNFQWACAGVRLETLHIERCRSLGAWVGGRLDRYPAIETLDAGLLTGLRSLTLDTFFTDRLPELPKLERLTLANAFRLQSLPHLPKLKQLELLNCLQLAVFPEYMPALLEAKIIRCSVVVALTTAPALEKLTLSMCHSLRKLPPLPNMKVLDLSECHHLDECPESFPALLDANIRLCHGLVNLPTMPLLNRLSLTDCPVLTLPPVQNLQYLDLWECPGLNTFPESLPSLLDATIYNSPGLIVLPNAPLLEVLKLYVCDGLRTLHPMPKLELLDLWECHHLDECPESFPALLDANIRLCNGLVNLPAAPLLEQLILQQCGAIQSLPPVPNLRRLDVTDCGMLTLPPIPSLRDGKYVERVEEKRP